MVAESQLRKDIAEVINRHSAENGSDTPDFILAEYLESCLRSFDVACNRRSNWYQNSSESSLMEPERI